MNRIELNRIPLNPTSPVTGLGHAVRRLLFGLFLIDSVLVWARLVRPGLWFGGTSWPEASLIVLAAATTLAELAGRLPAQNVLAVAVLISFSTGALQCLGVLTGIPFGRYSFTDQAGQQLLYPLPWAMPLLWLVILLNARGVARVALRPWRETYNYGYWLLAMSATVVILMDLGVEPFATQANHYWIWEPTRRGWAWYGAPSVNFLSWAVCAPVILGFASPFLINKTGSNEPATLHPLLVWLVLNTLILTGVLVHGLWLACAAVLAHWCGIGLLAVIELRFRFSRNLRMLK